MVAALRQTLPLSRTPNLLLPRLRLLMATHSRPGQRHRHHRPFALFPSHPRSNPSAHPVNLTFQIYPESDRSSSAPPDIPAHHRARITVQGPRIVFLLKPLRLHIHALCTHRQIVPLLTSLAPPATSGTRPSTRRLCSLADPSTDPAPATVPLTVTDQLPAQGLCTCGSFCPGCSSLTPVSLGLTQGSPSQGGRPWATV